MCANESASIDSQAGRSITTKGPSQEIVLWKTASTKALKCVYKGILNVISVGNCFCRLKI